MKFFLDARAESPLTTHLTYFYQGQIYVHCTYSTWVKRILVYEMTDIVTKRRREGDWFAQKQWKPCFLSEMVVLSHWLLNGQDQEIRFVKN